MWRIASKARVYLCLGATDMRKSIQSLSVLVEQEIQRPVGDRRVRALPFGGKPRQHVIGAHRAVLLQQDLQHPPRVGPDVATSSLRWTSLPSSVTRKVRREPASPRAAVRKPRTDPAGTSRTTSSSG